MGCGQRKSISLVTMLPMLRLIFSLQKTFAINVTKDLGLVEMENHVFLAPMDVYYATTLMIIAALLQLQKN